MFRRGYLCKLVLGTALLFVALAPGARADTYNIDGNHSMVVFKVNHLGVSNAYGRFNDIAGSFKFDPAAPAKSSIEITIKTESVDTHQERRDTHLRSPDFFNAKQFPVITLKSKSIKKNDDGTYEVAGELNLHGVKKDITVTATHVGSGEDHRGTYRSGFETTFTLKRSDFGMNFMPQGIGDDVTIMINVEGIRQ